MRRYGLDAAVHPIINKKWEAPYPIDIFVTKSNFYEDKNRNREKNNKPISKTTLNVGDRVYSKKNKRTAIIINSTLEEITIKYDDDGTISMFKRSLWTLKTPFLPVLAPVI